MTLRTAKRVYQWAVNPFWFTRKLAQSSAGRWVLVLTWVPIALIAIRACAGCATWKTRTVETHATSTTQVTAERVETAKATTSQDTKGTRTVRAGKSVVPRADGGWDVTWYFDELTKHEGETKREEVATVKVEAKAAKADDTNTKIEERRSPRRWPIYLAVAALAALVLVGPAVWRFVKGRL